MMDRGPSREEVGQLKQTLSKGMVNHLDDLFRAREGVHDPDDSLPIAYHELVPCFISAHAWKLSSTFLSFSIL